MNIMQYLKNLLFGVRVQGEKLFEPSPIEERPVNQEEFMAWCQEFNVSMLYGKKVTHF
jgi:hypothetical protein